MSVHFDFMNSDQHADGFHDNHLNFDGSSSSSSGGASDLEELEVSFKRSNLELFGVVFSHLTQLFTAGADGKKKKYGVTAEKIREKTGVDINDPGNDVDVRLARHPNIEVKEKKQGKKNPQFDDDERDDSLYSSLSKPSPTTVVKSYIYNHNYSLSCSSDILSLLERCHDGIYVRDVVKCYKGAEGDLARLIKAGEVVAVGEHKPDKSKDNWVVFPRGPKYIVELDEGTFTANGERQIDTSKDQTNNILRGESVMVRGDAYEDTWFKVSTFVKAKDDQPVRAKAPLSVSLTGQVRQTKTYDTMAKRNEAQYIYPMDDTTVPLDGPLIPNPLANADDSKLKLFRHGCTHDLKKRWFDTMDDPSFSKTSFSEAKLHSSLVKAGLALKSEGRAAGEEVERKRGSNKRRRKYVPKQQRLTTNTHLEGEAKISMERMLEDERRKKMEARENARED